MTTISTVGINIPTNLYQYSNTISSYNASYSLSLNDTKSQYLLSDFLSEDKFEMIVDSLINYKLNEPYYTIS